MKPLSLKITSHHLLLCVFLSLLWHNITTRNNAHNSDKFNTVNHSTDNAFTTATEYNFTLFAVRENVRSSGVKITAPTAPCNPEEFKSAGQNETSITLQWKKVDNISDYILLFNGSETNVSASAGDEPVKHTISGLTSGTTYDFRLFTLYKKIKSSGVNYTAATAPRNADEFKSAGQTENSITLQWKKVAGILNYTVLHNGIETNVSALEGDDPVTQIISNLTSATEYNFTLFTVRENVRSSGVKITAPTAPRNADEFKSAGQTENSITLQWKKVAGILNYTVLHDGIETNVSALEGDDPVTQIISNLTSATEYNFTLFTVRENVRSSGVKITAPTAPRNADEFKSAGQNENSITLQWKKVDNISDYILLFNGSETNVSASAGDEPVNHTISGLTSGTTYDFRLFTLYKKIKSSGVNHTAATAPRNADEFKSAGQTENSITLQWKKAAGILNYTVLHNGIETNVPALEGDDHVTQIISNLTSATEYNFTLFTVRENVRSSGVKITAPTAPRNSDEFKSAGQTENSITLQWKKVDNISDYILLFNGIETNVFASEVVEQVTHTISGLTSGTTYDFRLFTLYKKIKSSGVNHTAATAPQMVASVNVTERNVTSITLAWNVDVDKDWSYFLQINEENLPLKPDTSKDVLSHSITPLQPGTRYQFSVITTFYGLNSTAYTDFTVTAIDCASATWHVTNSSLHGMVEGMFTTAKVTSQSHNHSVISEGRNVSFDGLYPGATYVVSLEYEVDNRTFNQCDHTLTLKPDGIWTQAQVTVNGETYNVSTDEKGHKEIPGFLPARTYEVSLVSVSGTKRNEPHVFPCATDPSGVIAGSVFGVLLFVVLVCLAVFIFLKRPDIISRKKQFIGGSKVSHKKPKAISVAKFQDHFYQLSADENRGFSQEYEILSPVGTEQTRKEATLPENKPRNRFNNVLPYDWCRVKLTTSSNETSDYINASYMPGYNSNREYIATQGPLPTTINDFWRMTWEQRVKGIIMVTNCTEGGRTKCERYWPADSLPCLYGELVVTMRSEQQQPNWTLRDFRVKHNNTSEERTVKHFHFTAWPDHGVPQGTEVLIQFRELVRQHIQREGAGVPTVVHCSAGVGRTGTIIALDVLLQQLENEKAVDINSFVHKMRLSRPHMVQTESQYIFLHQCIMDCLQPKEKTEENIYENVDTIYENATALREFHTNA
ncbi:receptor-type tyrosine-protein phosphatase H-like [Symphorus nematophorus]